MKINFKNKKNLLLAVLYVILFALIIVLIGVTVKSCKAKPTGGENLPVIEEPENRVSFVGVGDNLIHDAVYIQANRYAGEDGVTLEKFDFKPMYKGVEDIIKKADIAYINQETMPAGEELGISSYPLFNSPSQLIYDMRDIGFDVFSQATNHTFDKTVKGIENAYNLYQTMKDEVTAVGIYKMGEQNFRSVTKNGIKIGFVNFTDLTNGFSLPASSKYDVPLSTDEDRIVADMKYARENCDFLLVLIHWGNENHFDISPRQKELAELFVDGGADAIIGTHPHVIQPVEYMGDTLVVYSLGNFISAQLDKANMVEGMISFDMVQKGDTKKIENVKFTPLINYYSSRFRDLQVMTLADYKTNGKDGTHKLGVTAEYAQKLTEQIIPAEFLNE
ncbi:MAG: CapA family protein [Clostridia bacterium]|nr:CapA family protein [Clostridia bacterium]